MRTLLSLALTLITAPLFAQDRAIQIVENPPVVEERLPEKPAGQKFAILVGVNEYLHPENFPTLLYPVKDVHAWQNELVESFGFERENIIMMAPREAPSKRPDKQKIISELDKLLAKVDENDLIICMFSGHGTQNDTGQYFCPEDARIDDLAESCVSLNKILDDLKKSPARFKWLIVDACRNDPAKSMATGLQSLGRVESVPKGVTAIFSCSAGEKSYEDAKLELGIFTHYLIKGLAGDASKDGIVTLLDLYQYVQKETQAYAKVKDGSWSQIPYWRGEFTNFILRDDLPREGVSGEQWKIANDAYKEAKKHREKKEYDNAYSEIKKALDILPEKPGFLDEKVLIESFLVDKNRHEASSFNKSAMVRFEKGEYVKAEEEIEKALKLFPNDEGFLHTKRIIKQTILAPREAVQADFDEWQAHYMRYGTAVKFINASYLTKRAYWETAAEKGMPEAQLLYGYCFYLDLDAKRDYRKMLELYKKAAEKKLAAAQCEIGNAYYFGYGVPQNYFEAFKWYQKAADNGYLPAQAVLGLCYNGGKGVSKNPKTAVELYHKAIGRGYVPAQYYLGLCYEYGEGVEKNYQTAVGLYRQAGDQGFAAAQHVLGHCYYYGQGVREDHDEAFLWFWKAAIQDYAEAQSTLGNWYFTMEDYSEAVRWYRRAADQNEASAQCTLGRCYEEGLGVLGDMSKAIKYYELAAKQGNEDAKMALKRLEDAR